MKSYVYFYNNGSNDLFGVENEMVGFDYKLATLEEVIKQDWADERDEERIFVLEEGEFMYRNGKFIKLNNV